MDELVGLVDRLASGVLLSREEMIRLAQLAHERIEHARWLLAAMYSLQGRLEGMTPERVYMLSAITQAGELALMRQLNAWSGD